MRVLESVIMQQAGNQLVKSSSSWPKVCYGIDLSSSESVVVRAEKKRGKVSWNRAEINNTTLAKAVGDQAVSAVCLSARDSLTRRLEAPFSSRSKALRVFPTLLDIQLPFSIEDCQYNFFDYRKTDSGTMEALAVAATKENINSKIVSVKEIGFDTEIIDIEGLATWSQILKETSLQDSGYENDLMRAVLILNGDLSSLTIGRGEYFLNSYGLRSTDVKRVIRQVKAHLLKSDEKVLWFIAGADATDSDLTSHWKQELSSLSYQNVEVVEDPTSFLARAVAIRSLSGESLCCNLRSGKITHPRIVSHGYKYQFKFAMLLLVTGIFLCAGNIMMQRIVADRNKMVNERFKESVDSLAGYHVTALGADAFSIVEDSIATRKADLTPFIQMFSPSLLDVVADILEVAKKNDLQYESFSLNHKEIFVSGTSGDFDASQELVETLVQAGYYVFNKRSSAISDKRIPFTITTEQQ